MATVGLFSRSLWGRASHPLAGLVFTHEIDLPRSHIPHFDRASEVRQSGVGMRLVHNIFILFEIDSFFLKFSFSTFCHGGSMGPGSIKIGVGFALLPLLPFRCEL